MTHAIPKKSHNKRFSFSPIFKAKPLYQGVEPRKTLSPLRNAIQRDVAQLEKPTRETALSHLEAMKAVIFEHCGAENDVLEANIRIIQKAMQDISQTSSQPPPSSATKEDIRARGIVDTKKMGHNIRRNYTYLTRNLKLDEEGWKKLEKVGFYRKKSSFLGFIKPNVNAEKTHAYERRARVKILEEHRDWNEKQEDIPLVGGTHISKVTPQYALETNQARVDKIAPHQGVSSHNTMGIHATNLFVGHETDGERTCTYVRHGAVSAYDVKASKLGKLSEEERCAILKIYIETGIIGKTEIEQIKDAKKWLLMEKFRYSFNLNERNQLNSIAQNSNHIGRIKDQDIETLIPLLSKALQKGKIPNSCIKAWKEKIDMHRAHEIYAAIAEASIQKKGGINALGILGTKDNPLIIQSASINLMTHLDKEKDAIRAQFEAWAKLNGSPDQVIPVQIGDRVIYTRPNILAFNFGVNEFAFGRTAAKLAASRSYAQNKNSMDQLIGSRELREVGTGGWGGMVEDKIAELKRKKMEFQKELAQCQNKEKMKAELLWLKKIYEKELGDDDPTWSQNLILQQKLSKEIQKVEKCEHDIIAITRQIEDIQAVAKQVADIWDRGASVKSGYDPYKMPSRIALLLTLLDQVPAFNCKSGKDRTGMLCIELAFLQSQMGFSRKMMEFQDTFNNKKDSDVLKERDERPLDELYAHLKHIAKEHDIGEETSESIEDFSKKLDSARKLYKAILALYQPKNHEGDPLPLSIVPAWNKDLSDIQKKEIRTLAIHHTSTYVQEKATSVSGYKIKGSYDRSQLSRSLVTRYGFENLPEFVRVLHGLSAFISS